jgi:hypothetical protein
MGNLNDMVVGGKNSCGNFEELSFNDSLAVGKIPPYYCL